MGKNNFDIARIILALVVVLVHSYQVSLCPSLFFLEKYLDSDFAVKGFFTISGFLISKSFYRSNDNLEYLKKRVKRIYPAYIFAIFLCVIIGAIKTKYNFIDFFFSLQTFKYILCNIVFMNFLEPSLPGVFENNPFPYMDGSLWTVKAEFMLYIVLIFVAPLMKKKPKLTYICVYVISAGWWYYFSQIYMGPKADILAKQFVGLSSYFFFGTFVATNKRWLDNILWLFIASFLVYWMSKGTVFSRLVQPIFYSSAVLFFCTSCFKEIKIRKYGDFSYGVYLYHWPILQLIISCGLIYEFPITSVIILLVLTIFLSVFSWHMIENKILRRV